MPESLVARWQRLLLLFVLWAPALAAQVPDVEAPADTEPVPPGARWRTSWFPYLSGGANDTPLLSFRVRHWQPAEYEARYYEQAAVA